jgi:hypothetical protein
MIPIAFLLLQLYNPWHDFSNIDIHINILLDQFNNLYSRFSNFSKKRFVMDHN